MYENFTKKLYTSYDHQRVMNGTSILSRNNVSAAVDINT